MHSGGRGFESHTVRKIVSGEKEDDEAETVEEVQAKTMGAEELLMDDGWKLLETEPEPVEAIGNGHHDTENGHRDPFGIGPAAIWRQPTGMFPFR